MTLTRIVNWKPTIPVTVHAFRRSELGEDHTMEGGRGGGAQNAQRATMYGSEGGSARKWYGA